MTSHDDEKPAFPLNDVENRYYVLYRKSCISTLNFHCTFRVNITRVALTGTWRCLSSSFPRISRLNRFRILYPSGRAKLLFERGWWFWAATLTVCGISLIKTKNSSDLTNDMNREAILIRWWNTWEEKLTDAIRSWRYSEPWIGKCKIVTLCLTAIEGSDFDQSRWRQGYRKPQFVID